jgi:nucleotidyltransferase/DNA polymerase involved in DNA repair
MKSQRSELQQIPGVGKSIAQDLNNIGIHSIQDLQGGDPEALYQQLCVYQEQKVDRCMLYVFRCAVYYASTQDHEPELLKWWNWKNKELHGSSSSE